MRIHWDFTNEYPGAVLVLGVPGNGLFHPQISFALIQLVDQLHFCEWTGNKSRKKYMKTFRDKQPVNHPSKVRRIFMRIPLRI